MYDPELTNYLTMIATVGLATFWAVCFMYGVVSDKVEPFVFSDKFELGYIDDDEPVRDKVVVVNESHQYRYAPSRATTKLKKKKRNKVRPRPNPKPAPKPTPRPTKPILALPNSLTGFIFLYLIFSIILAFLTKVVFFTVAISARFSCIVYWI